MQHDYFVGAGAEQDGELDGAPILHRREGPLLEQREKWGTRGQSAEGMREGAALLEFAIALPLLVVFVVGIYDFSGAFNQKQKIEQAAQEGAIIAGAQPMSDIATSTATTPRLPATGGDRSFQLAGRQWSRCPTRNLHASGYGHPAPAGLTWTYTISGCPG